MQENTTENYSINERIIQIIEYYNITKYKFAQETGISEAVLLNISKGKNKPSIDFIEKVLNRYSAINLEWLIMGKGSMHKDETKPISLVDERKPNYKKEDPIKSNDQMLSIIMKQSEEIGRLKQEIESLKSK